MRYQVYTHDGVSEEDALLFATDDLTKAKLAADNDDSAEAYIMDKDIAKLIYDRDQGFYTLEEE